MPDLPQDKVATIATRTGSSYTFKYTSLHAILETITPALSEEELVITQSVGTVYENPRLLTVQTMLRHKDGSSITSDTMFIETDGTPKDMGGKITTARRQQLSAFLCLSPGDEEDTSVEFDNARKRESAPVAKAKASQSWVNEEEATWETLAGHRKAVELAKKTPMSDALKALVLRIVTDDSKGGDVMASVPLEGKKISPYHYLLSRMEVPSVTEAEQVASFLYGRVINEEFRPSASTNWFVAELAAGQHVQAIQEAAVMMIRGRKK